MVKDKLLIIPNEYKKIILKNTKSLNNCSYMTIEELIKRLTFTTDEKSLYELMKYYNYDYNVAKTYLDNLFLVSLINDEEYQKLQSWDKEKVNVVKNVYHHLKENNFLIKDPLINDYLENKEIIIQGYSYLKKEYLKVLSKLKYQIIDDKLNQENDLKTIKVYQCDNIENELFFVLENICDLLNKGVNISNIKITGLSEENKPLVKQMFDYYHIPLNIHTKKPLNYYKVINDFFMNLEKGTLNESIYKDNAIYQKAINCLNSLDLNDDEISYQIKKQKILEEVIEDDDYLEAVDVIQLNDQISYSLYNLNNDCYLFILGFNEGTIPFGYKDEEYFKDSIKSICSFTTTIDRNKYSKEFIKNIIKSNKHLYISYSLNNLFSKEVLYQSSLINELGLSKTIFDKNYSSYSNDYNKLLLNRYLDLLVKYHIETSNWKEIYNKYRKELFDNALKYLSYDNRFKEINNDKLLDYYNGRIRLSYTRMDTYNSCAFAYYIENVLKLIPFKKTFPLFIGNLFHDVLSKAFLSDFDFEKEFSNYLKNYELSDKEQFLLIRLKKELINIIDVLKNQLNYISYEQAMYEKKLALVSNICYRGRDIEKEFNGIIDKMFYQTVTDEKGNVTTYVSLIDYKTGNTTIKIDLIEYGLSMQLPVYLFLVSKASDLKNVQIGGMFIQNILTKDIKTKKDSEINMESEFLKNKTNELKLDGYLIVPNHQFDKTEDNSLLIKSLKKTKSNDFSCYSKVLNSYEASSIIDETAKKIDEVYNNILKGNFNINPKMINGTDYSCGFCQFKDLCYKSYKDYIKIYKKVDKDNDEMDTISTESN